MSKVNSIKAQMIKLKAQLAEAEKAEREREKLELKRLEEAVQKRVANAAKRTGLIKIDLQQSEIEAVFKQLVKDKKSEVDKPKVEEVSPQQIPVNQGYGGFNSLSSQ
ncbi:hypothetical protein [Spongiibacter tropicus]|uniref:hypothetical protein n=1 Tax=Spongiibacter tropicus TaxID=454602 RepID=UPI002356FA8E|nr:hypothetical protein [Spongiibacter tropicus]